MLEKKIINDSELHLICNKKVYFILKISENKIDINCKIEWTKIPFKNKRVSYKENFEETLEKCINKCIEIFNDYFTFIDNEYGLIIS